MCRDPQRFGGQAALADLADVFGRRAIWIVPVLLIAGTLYAVMLVGSVAVLATTPYGQVLIVKVGLVSGLVGLAALNKGLTGEQWKKNGGIEARQMGADGSESHESTLRNRRVYFGAGGPDEQPQEQEHCDSAPGESCSDGRSTMRLAAHNSDCSWLNGRLSWQCRGLRSLPVRLGAR